jgi:hypothetical protein
VRFPKPIEVPLDDNHSLLSHSARLKGGSPFAEVSVFNGVPLHQDEIYITTSKARTDFAKQVKNKTGIAEDVTEKALLTLSSNLTTTLAEELAEDASDERAPSQATQLVELASEAEFFHSPDKEGFVTFEVQEHKETHPVKSRSFKRWLMQRYYVEKDGVAGTQALQDALAVIEAKACWDGPEMPVYLRVGGDDQTIYVDLGDSEWRCVKITKDGYEILSEHPIKFRRAKGMLLLPYPVVGGSIDELYNFLNVDESSARQLLNAWLIQALMPKGPYPPLALHGQQSSAKSTASSVLRSLIDPNTSPLRSEMRSEHDLIIAANNGWFVCLDNLSRLSMALSDAICRLATGGGFSTRELYTDSDEILFNVMRPVIINGIEEIVSRGDLLDRTIITSLPFIEPKRRIKEKEFWPMFEEAKPRILGALYDAVSGVLRELPSTVVEEPPRMADYAYIGTAAEKVFGHEPGSFMKAYNNVKQGTNDLVLEAEPVAQVTYAFIREQGEWSGRATDLLKELDAKADEKTKRLKSWPTEPSKLSNILRRLAPNLIPAGVVVDFQRVGRKQTRTIFLKYVETPSAPSAPSAEIGNVVNTTDQIDKGQTAQASADTADGADATCRNSSNAAGAGDQTQANSDTVAQVAFMVTRQMRQSLADLGYGKNEVDQMTPAEAWRIINSNQAKPIESQYGLCPTCGNEGVRYSDCPKCGDLIR